MELGSRGRRWSWAQEEGDGAGLKRKEMELGSHSWMDCLAACRQSPGEIKRREVELDSHSWMESLAAELFFNSCFSDTVFVTLFHKAVETAVSGVHKLLRTGGIPTS